MIKAMVLSAVLSLAILMTGCSHPYVPTGLLITNASGPFAISSNQGGSKEGEATARGILGLVSFGDAGIKAAAKEGGIEKIRTVDVKSFNFFNIYYSYTTVVTGE